MWQTLNLVYLNRGQTALLQVVRDFGLYAQSIFPQLRVAQEYWQSLPYLPSTAPVESRTR